MHGAVFVGVCAVMLADSSAFMHPFLWEDVPRLPPANASRRFQLPKFSAHSDPDELGTPWRFLGVIPVHSRIAQTEINTRRVESILTDLCSLLLKVDGGVQLERRGLDRGSNASHTPFLLRRGVRDIMDKYKLPSSASGR
jgi:hypothetical protein